MVNNLTEPGKTPNRKDGQPDGRFTRGQLTKALLLQAGVEIIIDEGNWRPTIASIARRAGREQRTFFGYWASFDAYLLELADNYGGALERELAKLQAEDKMLEVVLMGRKQESANGTA